MTKSELRKMTKKDLLALAKKKRISVSESMLKADIADKVFGGLSKGTGNTRTKVKSKTVTRSKAKPKVKAKAKTKPKAKTKAKAKSKVKARAKTKAKAKTVAKQAPAQSREWDNGRTIRQKAVAGKYELHAGPVTMPPVESMEIPADYGVTRIVAMAKDPAWLFTYWEITAERFMQLEKKFKDEWTKCTMALRIYDQGAKSHSDMNISYEARAYYVNVTPGGSYQIAIGVITPSGKFVKIAESAIVETPSGRMSDRVDEQWVIPEDVYDRVFAASGGHEVVAGGGSAEMRRMLEVRLEEQLSSESVSSFGSGELMPEQKERRFRLRVATELILYGATEPDAKVTIQGKPVKLRRDGTFTARFALPDGTIEIPVTAVSGDKVEERTIDTDVKKKSDEKAPVIK